MFIPNYKFYWCNICLLKGEKIHLCAQILLYIYSVVNTACKIHVGVTLCVHTPAVTTHLCIGFYRY